MEIIPTSNMAEYFMGAFDSARKKTRLNVSQETEFYIVDMLSGFADAGKFLEVYSNEPFAIMLKEARENENERFLISKKVGDLSSYMCGFFPESLSKTGNDIRYYIQIGKNGYSMASRLTRKRREIFREMTEKLPGIVDAFNEIRESKDFITNMELLDIYQRWLGTGSKRLMDILLERGIVPIDEVKFMQ